jgi:hypothetical protein
MYIHLFLVCCSIKNVPATSQDIFYGKVLTIPAYEVPTPSGMDNPVAYKRPYTLLRREDKGNLPQIVRLHQQ